jgi:hypothetical protein
VLLGVMRGRSAAASTAASSTDRTTACVSSKHGSNASLPAEAHVHINLCDDLEDSCCQFANAVAGGFRCTVEHVQDNKPCMRTVQVSVLTMGCIPSTSWGAKFSPCSLMLTFLHH